MRKLIHVGFLASMLFWTSTGFAQSPINSVLVVAEGAITVTGTTGVGVVYEFGTAGKYNTVSTVTYPLTVDCSIQVSCALLGGDPATGTAKALYAVQQQTAYTVTLSDGTVVTVPGLAPVTPPLAVGAVSVATDQQIVWLLSSSIATMMQYCNVTCTDVFLFPTNPIVVGRAPAFVYGGTGTGTLYVIKTTTVNPVTFFVTSVMTR